MRFSIDGAHQAGAQWDLIPIMENEVVLEASRIMAVQ
jgi:hypothetical protein